MKVEGHGCALMQVGDSEVVVKRPAVPINWDNLQRKKHISMSAPSPPLPSPPPMKEGRGEISRAKVVTQSMFKGPIKRSQSML